MLLTALPDNPDTHCVSSQSFNFNLWDTLKAVCKNLFRISVLTAILNWLTGKKIASGWRRDVNLLGIILGSALTAFIPFPISVTFP